MTVSPFAPLRRLVALAVLMLGLAASPALACDAVSPPSVDLGSYSSAALVGNAVPYIRLSSGFGCSGTGVLTLLSGNYLRATVVSGTLYTLKSGANTSAYKLAAQSTGTSQLVPGTTVYYVNGTTLNLLGSGASDVPVWIKPFNTGAVASGTYAATFVVRWEWYFCPGLGVGGACVGTVDSGNKLSTVTVTMTVAPKPATIAIASATTWDPVGTTNAPKAIPGSKLRMTLTVANPDIVALDANTVVLALPTPAGLAVALDGDGASSGSAVVLTQGATASTLTLSYVSPSDMGDNVDFSSDNAASWTYAPVAGDATTQKAVTHVRFRPQGSMAPLSSFSISVPYSVK